MLYYSSLDERKREKLNKQTMKNYSNGYVYSNSCIAKFEPSNISRNIAAIDIDRYNELKAIVAEISGYLQTMKYRKVNSISELAGKYEYVLRKLRGSDKLGFYRYIKQDFPINSQEIDLIIVLCTDPDLNYLNMHNYCIENNLNEENYYNENCGFYSKKLILMEAYTLMFYRRNNLLDTYTNSNFKLK